MSSFLQLLTSEEYKCRSVLQASTLESRKLPALTLSSMKLRLPISLLRLLLPALHQSEKAPIKSLVKFATITQVLDSATQVFFNLNEA